MESSSTAPTLIRGEIPAGGPPLAGAAGGGGRGNPLRTVLVGCGVGCLGLLLIAGCGTWWTVRWLTTPAVPLAPDVVIGPNTVHFRAVVADPADPGVAQLLDALAGDIDARRPGDIPPQVRTGMKKLGYQDTSAILRGLLPIHWMESEERPIGRPGEAAQLTVVSFGRFANLLEWIFDHAEPAGANGQAAHRGHRLVLKNAPKTAGKAAADGPPRQAAVTMVRNTVISGSQVAVTQGAIDRVEAGAADLGGDPLLKELRERIGGKPFAYGLVVHRDGALFDHFPFFRDLAESTPHPDRIAGASWDLVIPSADRATGRVHFKMRGPEAAAGLARFLTEHAGELADQVKTTHQVDLRLTAREDGLWTEVQFDLDGMRPVWLKALAASR